MRSKFLSRTIAVLLSTAVTVPMAFSASVPVFAATSAGISYQFSGSASGKAGYAEGTITFTASSEGKYKLYWADDNKALDNYYPIGEFSLKSGGTGTVNMGYHTAIPDKATKIIATTSSLYVSDAAFVYDVPTNKQLSSVSGDLLYTFSNFSDLHIDERPRPLYWVNAESNLKKALEISSDKGSDYIVISGDCVTCSDLDAEWNTYQKTLSQSSFCNPIWESDGNHDLKAGVSSGLTKYINATGTDGSKSSKSYFSMIEEKTGDLFIFMTLETSKDPNKEEVFSSEQISWAKALIAENYTKRNIFLVEHAPIKGYGPGDRLDSPYYGGLMDASCGNNASFKKILSDYPNIIFLSGHTHLDLTANYNYFNNNGSAANMIHTPALAGSTMPDGSKLDYNNGKGYNCQGYYVQVFENEVVFNGINITDDKFYPTYSYIMEGGRTSQSAVNTPAAERPLKNKTVDITSQLSIVKAMLSDNYKYASYDAYQAVKKLYYKYKNQTQADESVLDEFQEKLNALAKYTGAATYYSYQDNYYFVNNNSWSSVYCYAWDGSNKNAEWPGVKLSKIGTDSNGKDMYKVPFTKKGEYPNVIFNNGSSDKQTVDISLAQYQYNCFSIGSQSGTKYKVNNFAYDDGSSTQPDNPIVIEPEIDKTIALLYWVTDEHGWTVGTYLQPDGTGLYKYTYKAKSSNNFSCSLYNETDGKYYCLSSSAEYNFSDGLKTDNTLEKHSSRGKSVTIFKMIDTAELDIVYNPSTLKLTITCRDGSLQTDPPENNSSINTESTYVGEEISISGNAKGGTEPYTYAYYYKKADDTAWTQFGDGFTTNVSASFRPSDAGEYLAKVTVKDSTGATADKEFTVSVDNKEIELTNKGTISKSSVPQNTSVFVKGDAEGGSGSYKYAFYYKKSTSPAWATIGELYGNTTEVSFVPATVAKYLVKVNVKDETGKIVTKIFEVNSTKPTGDDLVNKSTLDKTTTQRNTPITITGAAAGGAGGYKYAFYYKKTTSKAFTAIGTEYGDAATATFTPASTAEYNVRINVKDNNGTIVTKQYKITSTSTAVTADLKNNSSVSATDVAKGTKITLTGAAQGGTTPYKYAFYYKKSTSSTWTKIGTEFGSDTTQTFTPAMKATYIVKITVKDNTGKTAEKTFTINSK